MRIGEPFFWAAFFWAPCFCCVIFLLCHCVVEGHLPEPFVSDAAFPRLAGTVGCLSFQGDSTLTGITEPALGRGGKSCLSPMLGWRRFGAVTPNSVSLGGFQASLLKRSGSGVWAKCRGIGR